MDTLDLRFCGLQFNILKNDEKLRKALFNIFFLIPLFAWLLLGPDSTADQITNLLLNIPNFLVQKISFTQLIGVYQSWYGLGTHWSAAVIYSLFFIGISKHLHDKLEVKNSLNISLTTGFTGLTIASFEFFWQASYAYWQNQHWILHLQFPEATILMRNSVFALAGIIVLAGLNWRDYRLNIDKTTILSFLATVGLIGLWWFYPFPTQQLIVQIQGFGTWISSPHFPQTMYTVQPSINVAYGNLYYVANDAIHLLNNLCKMMMSLFYYSLFKIRYK